MITYDNFKNTTETSVNIRFLRNNKKKIKWNLIFPKSSKEPPSG